MEANDVILQMRSLLDDPYFRARELKQDGQKVVGVTPMYFPEELIHAGGALPVVIQESSEPVTSGLAHLYPFFCGFTRSIVDVGVRGGLDLFDAMVFGDLCAQLRHMMRNIKRNLPIPIIYMQWPLEAHDRFLPTCTDRLKKVKQELEGFLGKEIEDSALLESFDVFNRNRALLRKVYKMRQEKPGILKASDMEAVVMSSMVMPKEENTKLLEKLISELEKRSAPADNRVKIHLSGHLCQEVKVDILDLIEDLGGVVVSDDLYTGYRYVSTDVGEGMSPLDVMSHRYLHLDVPCPTRVEWQLEWADYVVNAAKESRAAGVIILMVKHCGPHLLYDPYLKDVLTAAGIPYLLLTTEHELISLEGARTRLQAFIEMLRRGD